MHVLYEKCSLACTSGWPAECVDAVHACISPPPSSLTELQVPLKNETVFLGGEAHFFCQVLGKSEDLRIRVNGGRILPPHRDTHNGVYITNNSSTMDSLTVSAINIRIEARKANNNSVVECYDDTMGRESAPTATLTVKGKHCVSFINSDI